MNKDLHKSWLDNEYNQWVKALQESTVHNFKEHPMVKRMLGEPSENWIEFAKLSAENLPPRIWDSIVTIDRIGHKEKLFTTAGARMMYYALGILARNPTSICEIGGGVGQFYAILRALGYKGDYWIEDLLDVYKFQEAYLKEVNRQTGLNIYEIEGEFDMVISFYALGEFDDETKQRYFDLYVNRTPHGYIAWNPHSGASDDLSLFKHDIKVTPGIEEGIKIIQW